MSFLTSLRGKINDTEHRVVRVDPMTHALKTIDFPHAEIHGGEHYFHKSFQDLSINNVLEFTFLTPNSTLWTHVTFIVNVESETVIQTYENAAVLVALANPITPVNNNRNSANTSDNILKYQVHANLAAADVATNVAGAVLLAKQTIGDGTTGGSGGSANRSHELILKQNTLYCVRLTASVAGYVNYDFEWYENISKN